MDAEEAVEQQYDFQQEERGTLHFAPGETSKNISIRVRSFNSIPYVGYGGAPETILKIKIS